MIRPVVFSPAQAVQYAALKQAVFLAQAKLEEVQNFVALSVVSVEEVSRTTVTEMPDGLAVTVADA